jgi:hypothetical protein
MEKLRLLSKRLIIKKGNGNSFLFSLSKFTKHENLNSNKEIFGSFDCFSFGESDLKIYDNFDRRSSLSELGDCYRLPLGMY